jgi:hypothetical protein
MSAPPVDHGGHDPSCDNQRNDRERRRIAADMNTWNEQPAIRQEHTGSWTDRIVRSRQSDRDQRIPEQQLHHERRVAHQLDESCRYSIDERMLRSACEADDQAQRGADDCNERR